MTVFATLLGLVLIVLVLRDIFHTLFHPTGIGTFSSWGARILWRTIRSTSRHRGELLPLAGPLALVTIIATWAGVLAAGWALIYWPHLPQGFVISPGLDPDKNDGFLDALYVSIVTLATLGYGEITPLTPWLRIIGPIEALVGFALITASISWILSVYPVLGRRRQLAREINLLRGAGPLPGAATIQDEPGAFEGTLLSLAEQVIAIRGDLEQFPITYYFHPPNEESALSLALPKIVEIARAGQKHGSAAVRVQSDLLLQAVGSLAAHVAQVFLDQHDGELGELDDVLTAYSTDHLYRAE